MSNSCSFWEDNNPKSLMTICTQYCVKNLKTLCTVNYATHNNSFSLCKGITLPNEICERLIEACREVGKPIDDRFLSIFENPQCTRLRHVNLSNTLMTNAGLSFVLHHNLVELDISGCSRITQEALGLINRFGSEMVSLRVGTAVHIFPEMVFDGDDGSTNVMACEPEESKIIHYSLQKGNILSLPNLRKLFLQDLFMPLEERYFPALLRPLVNLTVLDLTGCYYVGKLDYLIPMKNLYSLTLYDVPRLQEAIPSICQLKMLRHLDLSQHTDKYGIYRNPSQVLAQIVECLPYLTSLDISGTNLAGTGVAEHEQLGENHDNSGMCDLTGVTDIYGLRTRIHNPLDFLGLFNTSHDACRRHHIPAKRITGDANEQQILTAAQAYMERVELLKKVLNDLFHIVRYETCRNPEVALQVILTGMSKHLADKHIEISGSASLFYIAKGEETKHFSIQMKQKIIKAVLDAMWLHRFDTTMIRNGCLTLCQFKIPQDVLFDYKRLVDILLHIVAEEEQEEFVQRIGIYLLNSLACQVDGNQKQLVGDLGAIDKMLVLIKSRLSRKVCDDVMEIAWSTMWNVTDETPENCQRFLEAGGMKYFLECLLVFPDKGDLLRNMMGLLGNVAEVHHLRPQLMTEEFISVFGDLLNSMSDGIEVSYNAAGVLSHIASDGYAAWTVPRPRREWVLHRMVNAIERWNLNTKRNINYRSFEPILRLLKVDHTPEVQHWAVWALANLTRVYPEKYCLLVQQESGIEMLQELLHKDSPYTRIKELALLVITHCERFNRFGSLDEFGDENEDCH